MTLDNIIRKHALKNAFDYGKANPGAVVGKVIAEFPDAKKDMKTTMQRINGIVSEVNSLNKDKIESELKNYEFSEKPKEEKKGLEVPGAVHGQVITRFPPEPSGYPHIGHAKAAFLDYEIARQYAGRMILRFDDTNPEKESKEFVDALKDGLKWLGISWGAETYTSDNMQKIYEAAEKLINLEKAYVCTCSQEEISKGRTEMKPCKCRNANTAENIAHWKNMLNGKYDEGKSILRFKGDLSSLNTVMRDPTLARIIKKPHYRQKKKYTVWPNYDLAVVVMDALEGITHPLRTKEYELRDELYFALFDILGYKKPHLIEISRLQIKNAPISKRLLIPLVKEKKVIGWDDPRLPTLKGLARRGILPEAVRTFVLSFGLSKVESEPSWEALLVENRKLLDKTAKHYFFVPNPQKLSIDMKGEYEYTIGGETRKTTMNGTAHIPAADYEELQKNKVGIFALKNLAFVKFAGASTVAKIEQKEIPEKRIQWVGSENMKCEILVPKDLVDSAGIYRENSLEIVKGLCESACTNLKEGDVIQFERFGFCRLDKKAKTKLTFVYSC